MPPLDDLHNAAAARGLTIELHADPNSPKQLALGIEPKAETNGTHRRSLAITTQTGKPLSPHKNLAQAIDAAAINLLKNLQRKPTQ